MEGSGDPSSITDSGGQPQQETEEVAADHKESNIAASAPPSVAPTAEAGTTQKQTPSILTGNSTILIFKKPRYRHLGILPI